AGLHAGELLASPSSPFERFHFPCSGAHFRRQATPALDPASTARPPPPSRLGRRALPSDALHANRRPRGSRAPPAPGPPLPRGPGAPRPGPGAPPRGTGVDVASTSLTGGPAAGPEQGV